jgi:heme/copper-type cytochrome/quinol oxidase subunit 2
MKGAILFIIVFLIVFLLSLGFPSIPPGQTLYNLLNLPAEVTTYKVAGAIYGDVLIKAIFNAIIYAFIAWLVFTILTYALRKGKTSNTQQNTNVQNQVEQKPPIKPNS